MENKHEEWFRQAEYDLGTAKAMLDAGRNIYAVFMCHLSAEKALRGVYQIRLGKIPPKTHGLMFLAEKVDVSPPQDITEFLATLDYAHIPTRYPENLEEVQKVYTKDKAQEILELTKKVLIWTKQLVK